MTIKEVSNIILNEYNRYHGKDGRFVSGGALGGGTPDKQYIKHLALMASKQKPIEVEKSIKPITDRPNTTKLEMSYKGVSNTTEFQTSFDGRPNKFHEYSIKDGPSVFVDARTKDHERVANQVADAFSRIPSSHREAMKNYTILSSKASSVEDAWTKKQVGYVLDRVKGRCNYGTKTISLFYNSGTTNNVTGTLVHEAGHIFYNRSSRTKYQFQEALKRDNKNVTSYGTKNRPEEAFCEAYSKYFILGKVTSERSSTKVMTNVDKYFRDGFGDVTNIGNKSMLLNEVKFSTAKDKLNKAVWTNGKQTITRYLDGKNNLVEEEFAERRV
jgi:hypothetical protein